MYKYTDKEIIEIIKTATIVVDTREQKCDHILKYFDSKKIPYVREKLEYGDFTLKVEAPSVARDFYFGDILTIERKANLNELSGNLAHERERMIKEFSRVRGQLILLIENATYDDIVNHNYTTQYEPKSFIATLKTFENRFGFGTHYQKDSKYTGHYIYQTLIYALRNKLKEGAF
ncbi:MAG: ERCC4 domain-containing protein [Cellulosilyticum sp.]|nr:ERCC4 domain-containing protein [Cellulosilyticum sp.]